MQSSRKNSNQNFNLENSKDNPSLKDFQVLKKLGEGSFGIVYQVKRYQDNQIYALKKVKLINMPQKERSNALNEIRLLASIESPFIIGYKEAFIDDSSGTLCLVLEYAENGDLLNYINEKIKQKEQIKEEQIWMIIAQLCLGLKQLHKNMILHRDLKCANIFIGKENIFKLGDLNVSKVSEHGLVRTQTGTPYYASPEVWQDKPYGTKSDVWSLGCVVYELITTRPPFRAQDMKGLYKKVIQGKYDPIPNRYSQSLQDIVSKMLIVDPAKRASVDQLLNTQFIQQLITDNPLFNHNLQTIKLDLLSTIKVNINLKKINLPSPKYLNKSRACSANQINVQPNNTQNPIIINSNHNQQQVKHSQQNVPKIPQQQNLPKIPINNVQQRKNYQINQQLLQQVNRSRPNSVRQNSANERMKQYSIKLRNQMSPLNSRNSSNNSSRIQLAGEQVLKNDINNQQL